VSHCAFFQQKKKKKKGKGGATTMNTDSTTEGSATKGSDANQSEDAAAAAAAAAPAKLTRSVSWGEDEVREFREEDMWKQKKKKWAAQVSTAMAHGDHLAGDGDML
jgi:hypothetical protein